MAIGVIPGEEALAAGRLQMAAHQITPLLLLDRCACACGCLENAMGKLIDHSGMNEIGSDRPLKEAGERGLRFAHISRRVMEMLRLTTERPDTGTAVQRR